MIKIVDIIKVLEAWAPPVLQESYDNVGLLTGNRSDRCTGVLCCLDVTEAVLDEAFFRKFKAMSEPDKKKIRKILDAWEDE